jgi:asparagine synthase (glutamine-hydrolysing)
MCGIYGVVRFDGAPVQAAELAPMGACLEHRGPDASGTWLDGGVGLGHQRLAIIDLSPSANQPMLDAAGELVIVFNGEIYNFVEQRERLEAKGVTFTTRSDTEVILALYRERGLGCVEELRGMFAFALYDRTQRRLLLARDRAGQKPLFYTREGGTLRFASEPKALFAGGAVRPRPDFDQLRQFLELGYVRGPRTAFEGVRSLAPGSQLLLTADGEAQQRRYWSLDFRTKDVRTPRAWAQRVGDRLRESVRLRMVSDVPLGAFLSSGIDSSAVVALMSAQRAGVKTFSIGFGDADYDEREYARLVARRFETDHHEYVVEPRLEEMLDIFVQHYDQPFGDPSAIPSLYLSRIARQEGSVTVVLNGDGADEAFGGYERYRAQQLFEAAAAVPGARRLAPLHRLLPESARGGLLRKGKRFLQLLDGEGASAQQSYLRLVGQIP